jgi:hypothetical protein
MTKRQFHNALRVLSGIDHHEVPGLSDDQWHRFRDDPPGFFIRCDDAARDEIWAAIERRAPVRREAALEMAR